MCSILGVVPLPSTSLDFSEIHKANCSAQKVCILSDITAKLEGQGTVEVVEWKKGGEME